MNLKHASNQSTNPMRMQSQAITTHGRVPALALMESIESPTPKIVKLRERIQHIVRNSFRSPDMGLEEWRRLEYRNEIPTRESERVNCFGIR